MKYSKSTRSFIALTLLITCACNRQTTSNYFIKFDDCSTLESRFGVNQELVIGNFNGNRPEGKLLRIRENGDTILSYMKNVANYTKRSSLYSSRDGQVIFRLFNSNSPLGQEQNFEVINYSKGLQTIDTANSRFLIVEESNDSIYLRLNGYGLSLDSISIKWCKGKRISQKGEILSISKEFLNTVDTNCIGEIHGLGERGYDEEGEEYFHSFFLNINQRRILQSSAFTEFNQMLKHDPEQLLKYKMDPKIFDCLDEKNLHSQD